MTKCGSFPTYPHDIVPDIDNISIFLIFIWTMIISVCYTTPRYEEKGISQGAHQHQVPPGQEAGGDTREA
ncbi:MAG: hypothetical protein IKR48_10165, partial [Kiritimatiellae bacterium]|nr:hypothetical protein [Kiritimatiellia bacterium]